MPLSEEAGTTHSCPTNANMFSRHHYHLPITLSIKNTHLSRTKSFFRQRTSKRNTWIQNHTQVYPQLLEKYNKTYEQNSNGAEYFRIIHTSIYSLLLSLLINYFYEITSNEWYICGCLLSIRVYADLHSTVTQRWSEKSKRNTDR